MITPESNLQLKKFHDHFNHINELEVLVDFFWRHYRLEEIFAIPKNKLTPEQISEHITTLIKIEVEQWLFSKPEKLNFSGYADVFFEKFSALLLKLVKSDKSEETKLENLLEMIEVIRDLKNFHFPETRFSPIGNFSTIIVSENKFIKSNLLATDYLNNPDPVLYELRLRASFYRELEIRLYKEISKLKKYLNSDIEITPLKNTSKFLVYEFVAVLKNSQYFKISDSEVEKIENRLFELLKIQKPKKRSSEIGHLNENKDKIQHLRNVVENYPYSKKLD